MSVPLEMFKHSAYRPRVQTRVLMHENTLYDADLDHNWVNKNIQITDCHLIILALT